jgi:hypothetical protein
MNHHSKTLHLLVEINNHLVEWLVDIIVSMSIMSTTVVCELGIYNAFRIWHIIVQDGI